MFLLNDVHSHNVSGLLALGWGVGLPIIPVCLYHPTLHEMQLNQHFGEDSHRGFEPKRGTII